MKLISCILLACFLSLMGCETQQQKEIKRLVGELKHEDPEISFKAKETLVETGREAVPFLIRALKGKGENFELEETLVKIGTDAVPALIRALQNQDKFVRRRAARILETIGEVAILTLTELLRDKDSNVRRHATWALGKWEKNQIMQFLL